MSLRFTLHRYRHAGRTKYTINTRGDGGPVWWLGTRLRAARSALAKLARAYT